MEKSGFVSLRVRECWSADARSCPPDQQFPFTSVACEAGRALELCARFVHAAELLEEVAAHARQEVVVFERRFGSERIDEFEACGRTEGHGECHGAVQLDHG